MNTIMSSSQILKRKMDSGEDKNEGDSVKLKQAKDSIGDAGAVEIVQPLASTAKDGNGGKHPFEIYPLLVWTNIFEHLKSPEDIENCSLVCTTFRNELSRKLAALHLPAVFPMILPYLSDQEKLNARLVCKSWAQLVPAHDLNIKLGIAHGKLEDSMQRSMFKFLEVVCGLKV